MSLIIRTLKRQFINSRTIQDPKVSKKLKGREGYRIRVADYRIIYAIFDDILVVDIIDLGHRKEVYD
jgi:mRNA interferase RelE/StbE